MIRILTAIGLLALLVACKQKGGSVASEEGSVTVYEGVPTIRDGDNVRIDGVNIRLLGIDACELGQPAEIDGREIDCGLWARDRFREVVGSRSVRCESVERDFYDRPLAVCYDGRTEINRDLVRNGYVFLYDRGSDYGSERDEAREAERGIWQLQEVERPGDYRRQN